MRTVTLEEHFSLLMPGSSQSPARRPAPAMCPSVVANPPATR